MNQTAQEPGSSFILHPSSFQKKPDLRGFEWYYYKHLLEGSSTVLSTGAAAIIDFALPDDGPLVTFDQEGRLKQWDPDTHRQTASLDSGLPSPIVAADKVGRTRRSRTSIITEWATTGLGRGHDGPGVEYNDGRLVVPARIERGFSGT